MRIKAVSPYIYPNHLNFKDKPFVVWKSLFPDSTVEGWYPKFLHGILFRWDIFPTIWQNKGEARIVFVQPVSLYFDAGISVLTHEIIPFIWDCWPCYYDKMEAWLKRHKVKTAIFTSRQEMEAMKQRCPHINMTWCPEAVNACLYNGVKSLNERAIDFLEFGRSIFSKNSFDSNINHVATLTDGRFLFTEEQLYKAMSDAKVTICLPRSITHPGEAQGIETLTQRYWEAMLSGMVIVGHAPQELIDVCGYNPCVEVRGEGVEVRELILDILAHIDDYQELIDRNRKVAFEKGDWISRIQHVKERLQSVGYTC